MPITYVERPFTITSTVGSSSTLTQESGRTADGRIVVGDFEGYVHLIDAREGNLVGRTRIDDSGISVRPVTEGSTIHVQANNGRLETLEVTP